MWRAVGIPAILKGNCHRLSTPRGTGPDELNVSITRKDLEDVVVSCLLQIGKTNSLESPLACVTSAANHVDPRVSPSQIMMPAHSIACESVGHSVQSTSTTNRRNGVGNSGSSPLRLYLRLGSSSTCREY